MKESVLENIKKNLPMLRHLLNEKIAVLKESQDLNSTTFGNVIEPSAAEAIVELCKLKSEEFFLAPTKNYFPDFTLLPGGESNGAVAIDFKAFRGVNKKGKQCNTPENDLGTFRSMPEHIEKFGSENMYLLFMEYNPDFTIENIHFDKLYKFCHLRENGYLKYRLKDGNLRPGDFVRTGKPTVSSGDEFVFELLKTMPYWVECRKKSLDEDIQKSCEKLSTLGNG